VIDETEFNSIYLNQELQDGWFYKNDKNDHENTWKVILLLFIYFY